MHIRKKDLFMGLIGLSMMRGSTDVYKRQVQGLIAMNIESAMAGDAVQSEIAAAVEQATGADSAVIKPLNTLATQLTGFDAFYQGLLQYTNGVDSAARAASQAVSYTHLDVYKRQALRISPPPAASTVRHFIIILKTSMSC